MTLAPESIQAQLPPAIEAAVEARLLAAAEQDVLARIWAKDPTVFAAEGTPEVEESAVSRSNRACRRFSGRHTGVIGTCTAPL